jgi:glycosyltransferase involved in cell wall biosynthesis
VAERSLAIALVTPWFGAELTGGAERLAWQVAHGLAERGHRVDVFATCARSFASDWGVAAHPAGASSEAAVVVRRYPVDPRSANAFDRANAILLARPPAFFRDRSAAVENDVARDFIACGINSSAAIDALRAELSSFDAVLAMPYPYGLPLAAVQLAGARAVLQPCLHDEPYAYLPAVEDAFRTAGTVLFNSAAERNLAYRLYGPALALRSVLVGHWIENGSLERPMPLSVRGFRPKDHRYVLYLGRRDATKNVDLLVESFARFRRNCRMLTLELVVAGPGTRSFRDARHGIRDVGLVDEGQKAALIAEALAIVQPSVNESFSRTVMEGWSAGKPVIVNARCPAIADVVRESGGGWLATTKADWSAAFEMLDVMPPAEREAAGARGHRFFEEQTSRERILDRYESAIGQVATLSRSSRFVVAPAPALIRRFRDGRRAVLFVGPLTKSACIEELLAGFAFLLSFGVDARLVLAGEFGADDSVAEKFFDDVAHADLGERVSVLDRGRADVVAACYRCADLFWSMAEDGPSTELVDALAAGVPVFAFANPVSRRVLDDCAILFNDKHDVRALAGVAALLLADRALRRTVLDGQQRRFEALRSGGELERAG